MADIFDFYVYDDRSIKFQVPEPIMQEDCNVTALRFHIPYFLNNIDMHNWAWWLVYTNARKQKFSEPLTLASDTDDPDSYNTTIYNVGYGMTLNSGNISFALEAIKTDAGGNITGEWHTRTYNLSVVSTLQGNQASFEGSEFDIISALVRDTRNKIDVTNARMDEISESIPTGTNLINPEFLKTGTVNGVTISRENDAIVFNGEASDSGFIGLTRNLNLEEGKQYTLKIYTESNKKIQYYLTFSGENPAASPFMDNLNFPFTFTVPDGDIAQLNIGPIDDTVYFNDEYRFSIMEGSTNPTYAEYTGDTSAIDIVARKAQAVIQNGAVTTAKLAGGSVTEAKLASDSVSSDKVQDGSLTRKKFSSALENDVAFKDKYKVVVVSSEQRAMCTALVDNNGNAILFDLSDETNGGKVVSDLKQAGVLNVVAVVISHYHHDHLGDYATIFGSNGLSYDNVQFFIPDAPVLSFTSQAFVKIYEDFVAWLESNNIVYGTPSENETVNINGVKLTFNNVDTSYWYNNYTPETFNYNWTSMCTYAEFASVSMQCMGDLYTDGLDYFTDVLNATRKATILNAVHHGLTIYINSKFIESCSPEVVINNYGTNNSYLNERNYATLIENYCNKTGIPVFDTADNNTFEILVSNGLLKYKDLTPLILKNEIITYPSYRDAFVFDNTGISVGQDMGIKTLLKGMPVNSAIKCRLGSAYQIYKDLIGSFGNYAVFEVSKIIGGSTNYLVNRTNPNDFWFEIKVTPFFEIVSETLNYFGYYDSINDTFHISKNKTVPMVFARMNLTKSSETDTTYSLSNASGTYQIGDLIHLDINSFTVDRTGIYEVTITGNNVGTSDSITLNGWKYNIDNGESASFTQPLSSGTPYQFGSTNSTSKRSMFATIKFLGSNIKPLFPE